MLIVSMGDSVTHGVRDGVGEAQTYAAVLEAQLRERGLAVTIVRRGVGGETTEAAVKRLDSVLALEPDYLTLMYGLNDATIDAGCVLPRVPFTHYQSHLSTLVFRIRERDIKPVLLTPNPMDAFGITRILYAERPPYSTHGGLNFMLARYAAAVRQVGEMLAVPVVDVFSAFLALNTPSEGLREYLTDGMHPNVFGHQLIADLLSQQFFEMLSDNRQMVG